MYSGKPTEGAQLGVLLPLGDAVLVECVTWCLLQQRVNTGAVMQWGGAYHRCPWSQSMGHQLRASPGTTRSEGTVERCR